MDCHRTFTLVQTKQPTVKAFLIGTKWPSVLQRDMLQSSRYTIVQNKPIITFHWCRNCKAYHTASGVPLLEVDYDLMFTEFHTQPWSSTSHKLYQTYSHREKSTPHSFYNFFYLHSLSCFSSLWCVSLSFINPQIAYKWIERISGNLKRILDGVKTLWELKIRIMFLI